MFCKSIQTDILGKYSDFRLAIHTKKRSVLYLDVGLNIVYQHALQGLFVPAVGFS